MFTDRGGLTPVRIKKLPMGHNQRCHCEERSDEAISIFIDAKCAIASSQEVLPSMNPDIKSRLLATNASPFKKGGLRGGFSALAIPDNATNNRREIPPRLPLEKGGTNRETRFPVAIRRAR